jgi:probable HAF family extracellular repeat protein
MRTPLHRQTATTLLANFLANPPSTFRFSEVALQMMNPYAWFRNGAIATAVAFSVTAFAATYTVTDLGTLGNGSGATGINASGQVVGNWTASGDIFTHGFLYSAGVMMDLGAPRPRPSPGNVHRDRQVCTVCGISVLTAIIDIRPTFNKAADDREGLRARRLWTYCSAVIMCAVTP